jgi:hypothetical protein
MSRAAPEPIFVVRLRAPRGVDAIKALRRLLKFALRQCGLRCVSAEQEHADRQP